MKPIKTYRNEGHEYLHGLNFVYQCEKCPKTMTVYCDVGSPKDEEYQHCEECEEK